jgi:hypothetical protein
MGNGSQDIRKFLPTLRILDVVSFDGQPRLSCEFPIVYVKAPGNYGQPWVDTSAFQVAEIDIPLIS